MFEIEKATLIRQIGERRLDLAALERTFTKDYPDFAHLQEEIAALEQRLAAIHVKPQEDQPLQSNEKDTSGKASKQFQEELREITLEEELLLKQQADVQRQIADFEARVARIPQREQMLRMLIQDYENARSAYVTMQQRVYNAKMSEQLEQQQKGEQFRLIEPARVPIKPETPDRPKTLMMGLALGLALGCGAVFLAEQRDHTFYDPEELHHFTTLPVLATIPQLLTTKTRRQRRRKKALVGMACVLILVASVVGVHYFWMPINVVYANPWQQFTFFYDFKAKPNQGLVLYFGFREKPG
jgi:capsular polysaccharide biosynthesis protein